MKTLNIGLIGAGRIGKVHAENLTNRIPSATISAVSDVYVSAAEQCAQQYNIPTAVADYRHLLDDPAIEAVAICSSTDTHAQIMREAAEAGKHIFCEKPIALELETIDQTLDVVAQSGVKLFIGFNRRFDPSFREAREMVANGKIGTPHIVRITSRDPNPPPVSYVEVSGGMFRDMTIHDFDMARYLINDEITELFAMGAVLVDPAIGEAGDIDTAIISLRYQSGAVGAIDNSRKAVYGYDQRVEVFGSDGVIVVGNHTPHNAVLSDKHGVHGAKPLFFFLERYTEAYIAEMQAFIDCIVNDTPPPVTGIDGRIPVQMALAAKQSIAEKRAISLT